MPRPLIPAIVFFLSLGLLYLLDGGKPLGYGYLDPAGKIEAQDEAVYAHIALRMAERGDWLTPHFLERYFLYKPPLLYWFSGAAVELLGPSPFTLRLPSLSAAAATVMIVFVWASRVSNRVSASAAALLLLSTGLFSNLANRAMTDALTCLLITLAVWLLSEDQRLDHHRTPLLIGLASAAAILVKSTAGLIPILIAGAWWTIARPRPRLARLLAIPTCAAAVAAPWFAWQYLEHPRWFWAEFVQVELLAYGAGTPQQTSAQTHLAFYASRLWASSPALCTAALAGLPFLVQRLWARDPSASIASIWAAVLATAILAFQYRNATYLALAAPALAFSTALLPRKAAPFLAAAALGWIALRPPGPEPLQTRGAIDSLERYCTLNRASTLIVAGATDQFHASVLPLARVRYALSGTGQPEPGFALDFRRMGIVVSVDEFLELDRHRPRFRSELSVWQVPGDEAVASVIAFTGPDDLVRLIRASPSVDFLVPASYAPALGRIPHRIETARDHLLLLGQSTGSRTRSLPCRM